MQKSYRLNSMTTTQPSVAADRSRSSRSSLRFREQVNICSADVCGLDGGGSTR